jgi:hypothetical protein
LSRTLKYPYSKIRGKSKIESPRGNGISKQSEGNVIDHKDRLEWRMYYCFEVILSKRYFASPF